MWILQHLIDERVSKQIYTNAQARIPPTGIVLIQTIMHIMMLWIALGVVESVSDSVRPEEDQEVKSSQTRLSSEELLSSTPRRVTKHSFSAYRRASSKSSMAAHIAPLPNPGIMNVKFGAGHEDSVASDALELSPGAQAKPNGDGRSGKQGKTMLNTKGSEFSNSLIRRLSYQLGREEKVRRITELYAFYQGQQKFGRHPSE